MKTTGYELREAIKRWQLRRDAAASQFTDSLKVFPGETKPTPESVMERFVQAEEAISALQAAQATYNLQVSISVPGRSMSLHQAVKLIGGLGRRERMWRGVVSPKKSPYHSLTTSDTRDKDSVVAVSVVGSEAAAKFANEAAKIASALRTEIAVANAAERDVEGLTSALFD